MDEVVKQLTHSLHVHRDARDFGNLILVIGILAEVAIEALWPERAHHLAIKRGLRATSPLNNWEFPLATWKGRAILVVGIVIVFGLYRERSEGNTVDDVANQVQTVFKTK